MCEQLYRLCQLQLDSIVTDLESSVDGVNSAATKIMQSFNVHVNDSEIPENSENGFENTVGSEIKNIIVGLQFHDELTQRLQHLQTLLHLLEEHPVMVENSHEGEKLITRISKIFSSNAEFNQFEKVFPGCHVTNKTDAIELF